MVVVPDSRVDRQPIVELGPVALDTRDDLRRLLEPQPRTAPGGLLLTTEAGVRIVAPTWVQVESTVRGLDAGFGNSFACLSAPGNTYVQCLRGRNGWHLGWRLSTAVGADDQVYAHVRGCRVAGSTAPSRLVKHDAVSDGERRDLLTTGEVLAAFRAFHRGGGPIADLEWRDLDI